MTIGKDAVIKAVLRGMTTANSKFEKWSKGSWVSDYGVEGFMVAHVAAALREEQDERESLLLEASFKEIRKYSDARRPRGRPQEVLNDRNRADITLFDQRDRTVHVIEVKRSWDYDKKGCFRDIERLLALLKVCAGQGSSSMKYGFLALPIVESAKKQSEVRRKIRDKAKNIEKEVQAEFQKKFETKFRVERRLGGMRWYPEDYYENKKYALAGFCLTFSNKTAG